MNQNEQQNGGEREIDPRFAAAHYGHDLFVGSRAGDGMVAALSPSASAPVGEPTNLREVLEEFDHQLTQWARAYPEGVFPEPDMDLVRTALEARGITIDCVSASNMRHVVTQLSKLFQPVRDALSASPLPQEPREAALTEPSGETLAQREEVCAAWADLPDELRNDKRLRRLYLALGGVNMEEPGGAQEGKAGEDARDAARPIYPAPQALSAFDHVAFDRAILALNKEADDLRRHEGTRMACARLADHLRGILAERNAGRGWE